MKYLGIATGLIWSFVIQIYFWLLKKYITLSQKQQIELNDFLFPRILFTQWNLVRNTSLEFYS